MVFVLEKMADRRPPMRIVCTPDLTCQDLRNNVLFYQKMVQGDPREAMLSMVPKVVQVAEDALAKKHKPKQPSSVRRAASSAASKTSPTNGKEQERDASPRATNNLREGEPLLVGFLREAQFLVKLDSSGNIKRDMKALRALLSPP